MWIHKLLQLSVYSHAAVVCHVISFAFRLHLSQIANRVSVVESILWKFLKRIDGVSNQGELPTQTCRPAILIPGLCLHLESLVLISQQDWWGLLTPLPSSSSVKNTDAFATGYKLVQQHALQLVLPPRLVATDALVSLKRKTERVCLRSFAEPNLRLIPTKPDNEISSVGLVTWTGAARVQNRTLWCAAHCDGNRESGTGYVWLHRNKEPDLLFAEKTPAPVTVSVCLINFHLYQCLKCAVSR